MTLYLGELPQVVECSQSVQLLQRQDQSLMRRWVHEVKVNQVIDACKENVSSYWTVTSTKESSNVFQRHNLNVWTDIILIVLSASTPHLNSSAEGLHFPSWSSESQGQSFPPSHVWRPRLCKAWNISQQPLCQHDPLSGWLKPEHKKKNHTTWFSKTFRHQYRNWFWIITSSMSANQFPFITMSVQTLEEFNKWYKVYIWLNEVKTILRYMSPVRNMPS